MDINELLKDDLILDHLAARDKEDALTKMANILIDKGYTKPTFLEAILERERHYPSGLPMAEEHIAIPHTDAEHINKSVLFFAKLESPVEFSVMGAPEQKIQVRMISMFALKEKKKIGELLSTLITVYQDPDFLSRLIRSDAKGIYRLLKDHVGNSIGGRA